MNITVAVDAMGGDIGPQVTIPATLRFLETYPKVSAIVVGRVEAIEAEWTRLGRRFADRLTIQPASEVVEMDESPALSLKNKKDSSMRVAIQQVKSGAAQACVSAGNTGALMATSRFVLKMLKGIDRPAIAKLLPTLKGCTCMLDLGANVECSPEQLLQFAIMGSVLMSATQQIESPTIGLLNIGSEEMKGNDIIKSAAELLRRSRLNFTGNVEGDDIYLGTVNVVVCDGFSGNIALKTSEGLAQMLGGFLKQEFSRNALTKSIALLASPVLKRFKKRVDPRQFNGASLLGLRGIVIKSHGGADELAFFCALERALEEAKSGVIRLMEDRISEELEAVIEDKA